MLVLVIVLVIALVLVLVIVIVIVIALACHLSRRSLAKMEARPGRGGKPLPF